VEVVWPNFRDRSEEDGLYLSIFVHNVSTFHLDDDAAFGLAVGRNNPFQRIPRLKWSKR